MKFVALMVVAAACGGGGTGTPDGPHGLSDGGDDDAAMPDAHSDIVDVLALTYDGTGQVLAGAVAIFYAPDDTIVTSQTVDASGRASASLPVGGSVAIFVEDPAAAGQARLTVMRHVSGGDHLVFGLASDPTLPEQTVSSMGATFAAAPSGDSDPQVVTCNGGSYLPPNAEIDFSARCAALPAFGVMLLTNNHFQWTPNQTYANPGTLALSNPWQARGKFTTNFAHVPADAPQIMLQLNDVVDGRPWNMDQRLVPPSSAAMSDGWPTNAGSATYVQVGIDRGTKLHERVYLVDTAAPTSATIDFAALPLPAISNAAQTPTGATWTETFAGAPDLREVAWSGDWPRAGGGTIRVDARIIDDPSAPQATSVLPPLPAGEALYDVTTVEPLSIHFDYYQVLYLDYSNLDSYARARTVGESLLRPDTQMLGATHTVHMELATPPQ